MCIFEILGEEFIKYGYEVRYLELSGFKIVFMFFYLEIRLLFFVGKEVCRIIREYLFNVIYIVIEGLFGWVVCNYCVWKKIVFIMLFYIWFLEYIYVCWCFFMSWSYVVFRWFYGCV